MNKRLICLFMSVLMLMSACLAGCAKKTDDEAISDVTETAAESTMTLTMYLLSEEEVSEEQAEKIQNAVNRITKSKFKTQLELRYFTAEDYTEALEKAFVDTEEAKAAKEAAEKELKAAIKRGEVTTVVTSSGAETEEATIINEHGIPELEYPSVTDYQVDIFYLGGYDKLYEYMEKEWLSNLNEELTSASKKINSYVAPAYLTYAKEIAMGHYAIPNNKPIGEYTYLLLNKELLAKYNYATEDGSFPAANKSKFSSLTSNSVVEFLEQVNRNDADSYIPLWSATGELDVSGVHYWGVNEAGVLDDAFSVIGDNYDYQSDGYKKTNSYYSPSNLLNNTAFLKQVRTLVEYKEKGYYTDKTAESVENPDFAVGYVKGGAELAEVYGDKYEMVVVGKPTLDTYSVFEDAFAVGAYTSSVSRSMEIITYLNTNEDFRNLILYGIEGEDYEKVEVEIKGEESFYVARRLENDYIMSPEKTGNTVIAYTEIGKDEALPTYDVREYFKKQNRDVWIDLAMGYTLLGDNAINMTAMEEVRKVSAEIYASIMACETLEAFDAFLLTAQETVNNNNYVKFCRSSYESVEAFVNGNAEKQIEGEGPSFWYSHFEWLTITGIYKEEE